jgi:ATP-binding cassette subfamily C protein LapB
MLGNDLVRLPAWLQDMVRGAKPLLRDSLAMSLVTNVLAIASPVFVLQVYDRVVFHNGIATLVGLSIGMIVVLAADYFFRIVRSRILQRVALEADVALNRRVTDVFMRLPLAELEKRPTATWQRLFQDVEVVRNMLSGGAAVVLSDLPFLVLFLVLITVISKAVLWVVLLFVAAFGTLAFVSGRMIHASQADERDAAQARDRLLAEAVLGRSTIKALNLEPHVRPIIEKTQSHHIDQSIERGLLNDRLSAVGHLLTMASTVTVIGFGALSILSQDLTMGGLIAGNMLASRLLQPLNQLVGTWRSLGAFRAAVARLDVLFALPMDRKSTALTLDEPEGRIDLDGVSFAYGANAPVIRKLSLPTIRPGGITAIIGPNGSGKTTLLKILMGLYPPGEGRVLFDGGDLAQFGRDDIARWFGYAPQETFLLSGSIRDNIIAAAPEADDDALREASRLAGLDEFVRLLPAGYDTDVGEAGRQMSGGVRQRIGLARAFLRRPVVLLLDEPTSNLDRTAEDRLRQSLIAYAAAGHTVVTVSHSPALLSAAREVLALPLAGPARFGPAAKVLQSLMQKPAAPPHKPAPAPEGAADV